MTPTPSETPAPFDGIRIHLPSQSRFLPVVRALVAEAAREVGFEEEARQEIALAITEALSNVMRHGYNGRDDRPIDLCVRMASTHLEVEINDQGEFVDPGRICSRDLDDVRPGGLGVHLMKCTMDEVHFRKNAQGGTLLTMLKRLPRTKLGEAVEDRR